MLHTAGFPSLTWVNPLRPDPKGQPGLISQKEIHVSQWLVVESRVSRIEFGVSHATGVQTFYTMKLSLTLHNKTYTVEDDIPFDAYSVDELLNTFKGLLVSAGYHPSTVDESIDSSDGNWFSEEERELCKTWAECKMWNEHPKALSGWNDLEASDPDATTNRDNFDDEIEAGSNHETDPS